MTMMPLFVVAACGLSIILQFDGSLRPPRDPMPGFTHTSNVFAKHLDGSEKLASCAASISVSSLDKGHEEKLIAVGRRYLPNAPGMTSADAEYDGLLLGLEWLVCKLSSGEQNRTNDSVWKELNVTSSNEQQLIVPNLVIRGDCKAVIDQLKARSIPRKMETKYDLAMERMKALKDMYWELQQRGMCQNLGAAGVSALVPRELSLCFEHVPRENNKLCDALCKLVINQKQAEIVESIQDLIRLGNGDASQSTAGWVKGRHIKMSNKKRMSHATSDFFLQALDNVRNNPQLCHSSRLALLCELTEAAIRQRDSQLLSEVSILLMRTSRRWPRIYYLENARGSRCKDTLRKIAASCEKLSMHFSGQKILEASVFADTRDLCSDGTASVFEFCKNYKITAEVDTSFDAISLPCVDVFELASGCSEVESLIDIFHS